MKFNRFLVILVIICIITEIILTTIYWDKYSNVLVAIGTLALAGVTLYSVRESNKREKNRIQEQINKENRDIKERRLNEIIEWAIKVSDCGIER